MVTVIVWFRGTLHSTVAAGAGLLDCWSLAATNCARIGAYYMYGR